MKPYLLNLITLVFPILLCSVFSCGGAENLDVGIYGGRWTVSAHVIPQECPFTEAVIHGSFIASAYQDWYGVFLVFRGFYWQEDIEGLAPRHDMLMRWNAQDNSFQGDMYNETYVERDSCYYTETGELSGTVIDEQHIIISATATATAGDSECLFLMEMEASFIGL